MCPTDLSLPLTDALGNKREEKYIQVPAPKAATEVGRTNSACRFHQLPPIDVLGNKGEVVQAPAAKSTMEAGRTNSAVRSDHLSSVEANSLPFKKRTVKT